MKTPDLALISCPLQFAQRVRYLQPRRADCRQNTADETHQQRKDDADNEETGRHPEGECKVREGLPVHRTLCEWNR